jgi:hypothetical protein
VAIIRPSYGAIKRLFIRVLQARQAPGFHSRLQ